MQAETRTVAEILSEMAGERAQLEDALRELRAGLDAKRKPAAILAGLLAIALVAFVVAKIARR